MASSPLKDCAARADESFARGERAAVAALLTEIADEQARLREGMYRRREEATMLGDKDVIATVAVKDLAVARKFYEGTLGLAVANTEGSEAITFRAGGASLIVYRSQFAGTNKATALNWSLGGDFEKAVAALQQKGVAFEHYDFPGVTRTGDIHVMGEGFKSAWFKDPDGNIIALMGR